MGLPAVAYHAERVSLDGRSSPAVDRRATASGEFAATSYILVYRFRRNVPEGSFYVAERKDPLRRAMPGGVRCGGSCALTNRRRSMAR
jgi:hypothetical protein